MMVMTIAIRPIWKLESRLFWLGLMSVPRPEVAGAVLLEEQVGLAERRDARGLRNVLDAERGVVLGLTGDQGLAQGVTRLAGLAVRLAVGDRGAVGVAVEDGDAVVLAWSVDGAEDTGVRTGQEVAREAAVALAAGVVVHRVARQAARARRSGDRGRKDPLRVTERSRELEVAGQVRHPVIPVVADRLG